MQRVSPPQLIFEQIALMFASFVWTSVILSAIVLFWAVQDIETNWNPILGIVSTATSTPQLIVYHNPTPSSTPWAVPSATPTATETEATAEPTATPTQVIAPPSILPDTPNQDDPTPAPVVLEANTLKPPPLPTATAKASQSGTTDTVAASSGIPQGTIPEPPTRLVIPAVNIDTTVVPVGWDIVEQNGRQYSIWHVADYAAGWHETSARVGEPGNTVLAGHHNINGEVFKNLVNVEVGDEIQVFTADGVFTYTIELKTIVKEKGEPLEVRQKNAQWIAPTTDERVTMVTCWPYTNNTHRVIVVAKPAK